MQDKSMTLFEIITQCGARICDSATYQWDCYGPNARFLNFADTDGIEYCSLVFDTHNYTVYEVCLNVPGYSQAFKWTNPDFEQKYKDECQRRNIDFEQAWDDVKYVFIDEATALEYAKDIGETYYDNLPIPEVQA
jgi:hypothetical protein